MFCIYFIVVHTIFIFDFFEENQAAKDVLINCLCPEVFCVSAAVSSGRISTAHSLSVYMWNF